MSDAVRQPRARALPEGIARQMAVEGGVVTFARFMELALTHPVDGYYSRAGRLLGPRGDFTTAPRLSREFNLAVSRLVEELVDGFARAGIRGPAASAPAPGSVATVALVEMGAGEGDLAKAVLGDWESRRPDLRGLVTYRPVEVGERLRARQRRALSFAARRGWRLDWAGSAGEALDGAAAAVVVSNEFFDALPVHVVDVGGPAVREAFVEPVQGETAGHAREAWGPVSPEAEAELSAVFGTTDPAALRRLTRDGLLELRPAAGTVMRGLAAADVPTCVLTVDYGEHFSGAARADAGQEAGPPLRGRTLRGYFRHQLVSDLYARVGRQDLTADMDFAALDVHGRRCGFETVLFTTVAALLRANGGEDRLARLRAKAAAGAAAALDADREATVLGALLDPEGVGGAFKVMLQVKE
jgi:SAM-dependent MidA family methyltransferase